MANELTWHDVLAEEKQQPYFLNTLQTVASERQSGVTIYPPQKDVFNAFRFTELGDVKVVITVLTVRAGQAHSHASLGWETFTDKVISLINQHREGVVFLLWGSHAQKKGAIIDKQRHHVLKAPHPSPLSAHRGFFGCNHFVLANQWLEQRGETPIDWMPVLPAESE